MHVQDVVDSRVNRIETGSFLLQLAHSRVVGISEQTESIPLKYTEFCEKGILLLPRLPISRGVRRSGRRGLQALRTTCKGLEVRMIRGAFQGLQYIQSH